MFELQPQVIGLGAFVGVLVGLTGMGGASLMTPLLVLVVGVGPVLAVGTDLVYSFVSKIAGLGVHARQQTVDWGTAFRVASGSVPGTLLGLGALAVMQHRLDIEAVDRIVLHLLGIMLILVAVVMTVRLLMPAKLPTVWSSASSQRLVLPIGGAIIGFLVGLTSVGSGTLVVVLLTAVTPLPAARIVGTDIAQAVMLLAASSTGHLLAGNVDLSMTGNLLIGSIPGVVLGSRLCPRFPERPLRLSLAAVLLISGTRLL